MKTLARKGVRAGVPPASPPVKEKAKAIACINNLKQMGLASVLHRNDADDRFLPRVIKGGAGVTAGTQFAWVGKAWRRQD